MWISASPSTVRAASMKPSAAGAWCRTRPACKSRIRKFCCSKRRWPSPVCTSIAFSPWLAARSNSLTASSSLPSAASFTADPLVPFIGAALLASDTAAEFKVGPYNQLFQACLDREIKSGSISAGLATRYDFTKHFEQTPPLSGSRYFLPLQLQTRGFPCPVPKSQNFHDLRCLNNSI